MTRLLISFLVLPVLLFAGRTAYAVEFSASEPITLGPPHPGLARLRTQAVASDGDRFVAVWVPEFEEVIRSSIAEATGVFGTTSRTVFDALEGSGDGGVTLMAEEGIQIAYGKDRYLAAFVVRGPTEVTLFVQAIGRDGAALGEPQVVRRAQRLTSFRIAFNGSDFLVVYAQGGVVDLTRSTLREARVTSEGAVVSDAILQDLQCTYGLRVAAALGSFLVVCTHRDAADQYHIAAVIVGEGGATGAPFSLVGDEGPASYLQVELVATGDEYLLLWVARDPAYVSGELRTARVDVSGAVLDRYVNSSAAECSQASGIEAVATPHGAFVVIRQSSYAGEDAPPCAAAIEPSGRIATGSPGTFPIGDATARPVGGSGGLAANGSVVLYTYLNRRLAGETWGRAVVIGTDASGFRALNHPRFAWHDSAPTQPAPIAGGQGSYGVLWNDAWSSQERKGWFQRFDPNGAPLDEEPFLLPHPGTSIAQADGNYLIALESSELLLRRADGSLSPVPIDTTVALRTTVAATEHGFLAVSEVATDRFVTQALNSDGSLRGERGRFELDSAYIGHFVLGSPTQYLVAGASSLSPGYLVSADGEQLPAKLDYDVTQMGGAVGTGDGFFEPRITECVNQDSWLLSTSGELTKTTVAVDISGIFTRCDRFGGRSYAATDGVETLLLLRGDDGKAGALLFARDRTLLTNLPVPLGGEGWGSSAYEWPPLASASRGHFAYVHSIYEPESNRPYAALRVIRRLLPDEEPCLADGDCTSNTCVARRCCTPPNCPQEISDAGSEGGAAIEAGEGEASLADSGPAEMDASTSEPAEAGSARADAGLDGAAFLDAGTKPARDEGCGCRLSTRRSRSVPLGVVALFVGALLALRRRVARITAVAGLGAMAIPAPVHAGALSASPPVTLDDARVDTPSLAEAPSVASDGSDFVVVWRSAWALAAGYRSTLVRPDGTAVPPHGTPLLLASSGFRPAKYSRANASKWSPYVIPALRAELDTANELPAPVVVRGDPYLAVLPVESGSAEAPSFSILAQRLDATGAPLGDAFAVLDAPPGDAGSPGIVRHVDLAFDGARFGMVWQEDASAGPVVRGRLFDGDGQRLGDLDPFGSRPCMLPQVAGAGGRFLVGCHLVPTLSEGVVSAVIDELGQVGPVSEGILPWVPGALVSTGSDFLACAEDCSYHIDLDGLRKADSAICNVYDFCRGIVPVTGGYLRASRSGATSYLDERAGSWLGTTLGPIGSRKTVDEMAFGSNGTSALLVHTDYVDSPDPTGAYRRALSGTVFSAPDFGVTIDATFFVASRTNLQIRPVVAANPGGTLAAWVDDRWGGSIVGTYVGDDGEAAPGGPFEIAGLDAHLDRLESIQPQIAGAGSTFLTTWLDEFGTAQLAIVEGNVSRLVEKRHEFVIVAKRITAAATPGGYLVVWEGPSRGVLNALALDEEGHWLTVTPELLRATASDADFRFVIVGEGQNYAVAWREPGGEVRYRLVDSKGVPLGASESLGASGIPLAWAMPGAFAIGAATTTGVTLRVVDAAGQVLHETSAEVDLSAVLGDPSSAGVSAAHDGEAAVVVFTHEGLDDGSAAALAFSSTGEMLTPAPLELDSARPWNASVSGTIASPRLGRYVVTYPSVEGETLRAYARALTWPTPGDAGTPPADSGAPGAADSGADADAATPPHTPDAAGIETDAASEASLPSPPRHSSSEGCDCAVGNAGTTGYGSVGTLALLALAFVRRRNRNRSAPASKA